MLSGMHPMPESIFQSQDNFLRNGTGRVSSNFSKPVLTYPLDGPVSREKVLKYVSSEEQESQAANRGL